jgi:hypothetical protein
MWVPISGREVALSDNGGPLQSTFRNWRFQPEGELLSIDHYVNVDFLLVPGSQLAVADIGIASLCVVKIGALGPAARRTRVADLMERSQAGILTTASEC